MSDLAFLLAVGLIPAPRAETPLSRRSVLRRRTFRHGQCPGNSVAPNDFQASEEPVRPSPELCGVGGK